MPTRSSAPLGAPCWADLWTSDVDGSRRFYGELFGWEAADPDPEFGGYFTFMRDGVDVAGGMGDMGENMPANDTWKIYLATDDITKTAETAEASGAQIISPAMAVGDLGIQLVMIDPTGAHLGAWQAEDVPGLHRRCRARFPGVVRVVHPGSRQGASTSTARYSTGTRLPSVTATSSGTRPWAIRWAVRTWPASWTRPASCPTGYPPTGRCTGRSTMWTAPSARSEPLAA